MEKRKLYFDANATTPLREVAREVWCRVEGDCWYNPSSPFREGGRARRVLEEARETIGRILQERGQGRLVFTSGATEANNIVLSWAARQARVGVHRPGLLISAVEHPSVREAALAYWPEEEIIVCPVNAEGETDRQAWRALLAEKNPGFASCMAANNETGVWQPWRELAEDCATAGTLFHCDAVQLPGKASLKGLSEIGFYTLSAHKFGGPKGCGLLRLPAEENSLHGQYGGAQESGIRSGTEAPALIAAMAAALSKAGGKENTMQDSQGRDRFEEHLRQRLPGVKFAGAGGARLANTSFVLFPQGDQLRWVRLLDRVGVMVSTGAACATGKEGPSHVLTAMGYGAEEARRSVRFSALPEATVEDWSKAAQAVWEVWQKITPPERG